MKLITDKIFIEYIKYIFNIKNYFSLYYKCSENLNNSLYFYFYIRFDSDGIFRFSFIERIKYKQYKRKLKLKIISEI